jgi:hypothetical protein
LFNIAKLGQFHAKTSRSAVRVRVRRTVSRWPLSRLSTSFTDLVGLASIGATGVAGVKWQYARTRCSGAASSARLSSPWSLHSA